jgi:hypothetical protein
VLLVDTSVDGNRNAVRALTLLLLPSFCDFVAVSAFRLSPLLPIFSPIIFMEIRACSTTSTAPAFYTKNTECGSLSCEQNGGNRNNIHDERVSVPPALPSHSSVPLHNIRVNRSNRKCIFIHLQFFYDLHHFFTVNWRRRSRHHRITTDPSLHSCWHQTKEHATPLRYIIIEQEGSISGDQGFQTATISRERSSVVISIPVRS